MTFKNYAVQYEKLLFENTKLETIELHLSSYSKLSRTRKDNRRSLVGQMAVNNEGQIVSLNQSLISIWKLPQHIVEARCEQQVFLFIAEQLENPQSFLINTKNIYEQIDFEMQDLVKSKNGKILLYLTKYQCLEEKIVGRIWKFWEIIPN